MTVSMPTDVAYGKVVGRFILAVADTSDADRLPNATAAVGEIVFTPALPNLKTYAPSPTTVVRTSIKCTLNANGELVDELGSVGVWLMVGVYKVNYTIRGATINASTIEILEGHNDSSPLDLTNALSFGGAALTPTQYEQLSSQIAALQNASGSTGPEGPPGPPGADGADGPAGPPGPSPSTVVFPSGDLTGATDVAAINAALLASQNVTLAPGAFYCNAPIYLQSGNRLEAYGASVTLTVSGTNLIRTHAADAVRMVSDATSVYNSNTLTSPTANFTAADIGKQIQFEQGGYSASSWYGTINGFTNSTTVNVAVKAQSNISGTGVLYIFGTRDSDITVAGGRWNTPDPVSNSHQAAARASTQFSTLFRRVDRLTVRDMVWNQLGATGAGGRFVLSFGDVTDLVVNNIRFIRTAGDGVHLNGPIARASVSDIFGTTGDDFVVTNTTDTYGPSIIDVQGDILDVVVERLYPNASISAFKHYTTDSLSFFKTYSLTVRSVKGSTSNGIRLDGDATGVLIQDIEITTSGGTVPAVSVNNTRTNDLTIDGVVWSANVAPTNGIVSLSAGRTATVRNITMLNAPSGTCIGVKVANGTGYVLVTIDGIRFAGTNPATFYAVQCAGGTVQKLSIRNVHLSSTSGRLLDVSSATTIVGANIDDCTVVCPTLATILSSTTAVLLRLSNIAFTGVSLVSSGAPVTLELNNVDVNTTAAVLALVGVNATPNRVRLGDTCAQAGAGALLSRDGSQVSSVTGRSIAVDQTLLTPNDGDMISNSNATPLNGVGTALYNSTAAKWKNLYSGVTS